MALDEYYWLCWFFPLLWVLKWAVMRMLWGDELDAARAEEE